MTHSTTFYGGSAMAFKRSDLLDARPTNLTADMVGIGMGFAAMPNHEADVERTLVFASDHALNDDDLRVLAVLTSWLHVHSAHINADRLTRMVRSHASERVRAYWSAIGDWLSQDRRFARLRKAYSGTPRELLRTGTQFRLSRHGEDQRFAGSALVVPAKALPARAGDVVPSRQLAQLHLGYRNRVRMGPTWRTDVWTELERAPKLSPAEVARRVGCGFATAWHAVRDFSLLQTG